jgi:uncharacterized protein YjbJ (UPF0337 family)
MKVQWTMDKDRVIGAGKQMMGTVKEAVGKLVGDAKLQVDGKAEQIEGKLQNDAGSAKDTLQTAVDNAKSTPTR